MEGIPFMEQYSSNEYYDLLNRYNLLPKRKKDFKKLVGIRVRQQDFEQFYENRTLTAPVMAFGLNYCQNLDQLRGDASRHLFMVMLEINYDEQDEFRVFSENLIQKQFISNLQQYCIAVILKTSHFKGYDKKIWTVAMIRLPDQQLSLFANLIKPNELVMHWEKARRILDGILDHDFYPYRINDHLGWILKNLSYDGGLEVLWYLYQFARGVEIEKIPNVAFDNKQWHKELIWLMFKLKFAEPDTPEIVPEKPFEEREYKYKYLYRYFREDRSIISIDPKIYFDFGKYINVQNYAVTVGMQDAATATIEFGVSVQGGQIPRKPKLNQLYANNESSEQPKEEQNISETQKDEEEKEQEQEKIDENQLEKSRKKKPQGVSQSSINLKQSAYIPSSYKDVDSLRFYYRYLLDEEKIREGEYQTEQKKNYQQKYTSQYLIQPQQQNKQFDDILSKYHV